MDRMHTDRNMRDLDRSPDRSLALASIRCIRSFRVQLLLLAITFSSSAYALSIESAEDQYDRMLAERVDDRGWVDYAGLSRDREALDFFVETIADWTRLDQVEPHARLAGLINAYNAFTLQLILDHYDAGKLESITDLHGGKPWDQKVWNLGGEMVSLNQIEHEMIRPVFDEPRIHWALVCAAYSCPPLRAEGYTAERLEEQLADQESRVLMANDPRFIRVDPHDNTVTAVTSLFEWYGEDFGEDWKTYVRDVTGFHVKMPRFIEYDWTLNAQANRPE